MSNSSTWTRDTTLSGATTYGQSDSNEEVLYITQNSKAGALSSDSFNVISGTLVEEEGVTSLQRCS